MALVAKTAAISTPSNVSANRASNAAGGRNGGGFDGSPIDELTASASVFYGEDGLHFRDEERELSDKGQGFSDRGQTPILNVGGITAPSVDFAAFFEINQFKIDGGGSDYTSNSQFGVSISTAVNRYEANARVVAGLENIRGESINLNL